MEKVGLWRVLCAAPATLWFNCIFVRREFFLHNVGISPTRPKQHLRSHLRPSQLPCLTSLASARAQTSFLLPAISSSASDHSKTHAHYPTCSHFEQLSLAPFLSRAHLSRTVRLASSRARARSSKLKGDFPPPILAAFQLVFNGVSNQCSMAGFRTLLALACRIDRTDEERESLTDDLRL